MPESARILQFPERRAALVRTPYEVNELSREYLRLADEDRSDSLREICLRDADVLLAICKDLGEGVNSDPALVADEAEGIHRSLESATPRVGVFDDKDYLLGEFALLAGTACRLLGRREKTEIWLDKAESSFRHTIGPAASLARVALERTALQYDTYNYERVLEGIPSL
jgi:hypothetical protein